MELGARGCEATTPHDNDGRGNEPGGGVARKVAGCGSPCIYGQIARCVVVSCGIVLAAELAR